MNKETILFGKGIVLFNSVFRWIHEKSEAQY
jgi:hypothetical protein